MGTENWVGVSPGGRVSGGGGGGGLGLGVSIIFCLQLPSALPCVGLCGTESVKVGVRLSLFFSLRFSHSVPLGALFTWTVPCFVNSSPCVCACVRACVREGECV